jgi:hypothetical protein
VAIVAVFDLLEYQSSLSWFLALSIFEVCAVAVKLVFFWRFLLPCHAAGSLFDHFSFTGPRIFQANRAGWPGFNFDKPFVVATPGDFEIFIGETRTENSFYILE